MKIDIDIDRIISDLADGVNEARDKDVFYIDLPVDTATDAIRVLITLLEKEDQKTKLNEDISESAESRMIFNEKRLCGLKMWKRLYKFLTEKGIEVEPHDNIEKYIKKAMEYMDSQGEEEKTSFLCSGDGKEICNTCKNYIYNGNKEEDQEEGEQFDDFPMSIDKYLAITKQLEYFYSSNEIDEKSVDERMKIVVTLLKELRQYRESSARPCFGKYKHSEFCKECKRRYDCMKYKEHCGNEKITKRIPKE